MMEKKPIKPIAATHELKTPRIREQEVKVFNPYLNIDLLLDKLERDVGITGNSFIPNEKRQTSGLLCIDLLMGGGILPGWYTVYGKEQSCKSTLAMTALIASLHSGIPIISYFDYEGSNQTDYLENMMEAMGMRYQARDVFGIRNPKTNKWEIPPMVRINSSDIGEQFFDFLSRLCHSLPHKLYIGESWYYVYKDTKENRAIVGDNFDKAYYTSTKRLRVPAEDGSLQALLILDSYPAMLPESQDDDPSKAIAVQARFFSDNIKRVKGKLKGKRIAIVGVNQLRDIPMAMFGPTEQEPCGNALKFFSDVRIKATARVLSGVPVSGFNTTGTILKEQSLDGGIETYRFINLKATKNKLSVPYLETWARLCITDSTGKARGFDIVWDTFYYLHQTGQIEGNVKKIKIRLENGTIFSKTLTWIDFKKLILGSKADIMAICTDNGVKSFRLRDYCKKQLHSGNGVQLHLSKLASKEKADPDAE